MSLNQKITSQIFSAYLNCEYKAYLTQNGKDGIMTYFHDFNNEILRSSRKQYREKFCENLTSSFGELFEKTSISSRILKNGFDKLFMFLDKDGVPWNNNNAEHAFKHFATYRRNTNGVFTEKGLKKYLILLSLYETCNYQGINFLDFLLSKKKNL